MMEKVILNVQIPYIMELSNFFMEALTDPEGAKSTPDSEKPSSQLLVVPEEDGPVTTVYFSVKQPEIVLLADPESSNSRVIVVNVSHLYPF